MTVVPGFIDCHNHAGGDVLLNEVLVGNPFEVEFVSIASIIAKLKAKAQQTPPGHLGRRLLLRRHQAQRQARVEHPGPRRGLHSSSRSCGTAAGIRTSTIAKRSSSLVSQGHAQSERRHLRQGRQGDLNGRVTDLRLATVQQGRRRPTFTSAQIEQRYRDGLALHLQTVRALWLDQRAPRRRQPAGHAGCPRTRGAAASHQLRDERPRAGSDDCRRHPDGFRRRVDQVRRHVRAHRGRLVLRAHDGAQHALPRCAPPYNGNVTETQDT